MTPSKSTQRRMLYWLSGLIVLYGFALPIVAGIASIFYDWDEEPGALAKLVFFGVPAVSTVVFVAGLAAQARDPRRGLPFIIAGAIGPAIWFWMLPIYAPFMIAVIVLAVSITPRKNAKFAAA